jgi:peptidoglycan hydrolase CwlO-like protein
MNNTALDTVLDMTKFQTTETQLESYIETLRSTVAMLNSRIGELQDTLSQVRGKITQLKDDNIILESSFSFRILEQVLPDENHNYQQLKMSK